MRARLASVLLLCLSLLACTSTATVGRAPQAGMDGGSPEAPPMDAALDAGAHDATAPDAAPADAAAPPDAKAERDAGTPPRNASDAQADANTEQPDAGDLCSDDDDCPGALMCADGMCVECADDDDCTDREETRCDARGRCVECTSSAHCTIAGTVCAPWGECEFACTSSAQCPGSLRCDEIARVCLECVFDEDCARTGDFCDEGVCRPCALDSDCPTR